MKKELENNKVRLYPSDWRFSASIIGLCLFFDYSNTDYIKTDDYIEYKKLDVDENFKKNYLLFAENFFSEYMHHKIIENLLVNDEINEEDSKIINDKLVANTIMKTIFKGVKFSEENIANIKNLIEINRLELIEKTFATGKKLYAKYSNSGKIFSQTGEVCRLLGYYEDTGRKSKSLAYNWDKSTFIYNDSMEFDFIPFAFSKSGESFFINNNISVNELIKTQKNLQNDLQIHKSPRKLLFQLRKSANFLDYNVEIMVKTIDNDYFETIYVRQRALEIFEKIDELSYDVLTKPCKCGNEYIDIEKNVVNDIINNIFLDSLIIKLFKFDDKYFLIRHLIQINILIYGGSNMNEKIQKSRNTAYIVKQNLEENKLKSYRQKLISAISFNDYDRFCKVLLQLSDYSGVIFEFAYDLFDDFDENKNIAFSFVNGLNDMKKDGSDK